MIDDRSKMIGLVSVASSIVTIYVFVTGQSSMTQALSSIWKVLRGSATVAKSRSVEPAGQKVELKQDRSQDIEDRFPYEDEILRKLGGCGVLRSEWSDPNEGDRGMSFGPSDPDPWLECQEGYLALLVERYRISLERQDVERKAVHGFSPVASETFRDFQANQRTWERFREMRCTEETEIIGAEGSGSIPVWSSCMAKITEDRIGTISLMKQRVDEYVRARQNDFEPAGEEFVE